MTANLRWMLVAGAVLLIVVGVFRLWQDAHAGRDGRVLVLDARTGRTLHERSFSGGWVVAALLSGGRIAVADEDSCQAGAGGEITVWDATLEHELRGSHVSPCIVARLDPHMLRRHFGDTTPGLGPNWNGGKYVSVPLQGGQIVENLAKHDDGYWYDRLTAYDAGGHVLWRLSVPGHILGVVDAREGRVIVPVAGKFTPGTD